MPPERFDLNDRLLQFAAAVADVVKALPTDLMGQHIARQLVRSGTAPAAHHSEAQSAESPRDFIHKMRMALKELRETRTWLRLGKKVQSRPTAVDTVLQESDELIAIFVTSIKTAERNKSS